MKNSNNKSTHSQWAYCLLRPKVPLGSKGTLAYSFTLRCSYPAWCPCMFLLLLNYDFRHAHNIKQWCDGKTMLVQCRDLSGSEWTLTIGHTRTNGSVRFDIASISFHIFHDFNTAYINKPSTNVRSDSQITLSPVSVGHMRQVCFQVKSSEHQLKWLDCKWAY